MVIGPLAGGWLIDVATWRWIFAINVPFVIATVIIVRIAVSERPRAGPRVHLDYLGATLCALGLAGPVFALIRQPSVGWGSPEVLVPAIAGVVMFALFIVHEARTPHPMLPLGLFRRRNFAVGNLETLLMYGGLSAVIFFLVLFLQQVAGYDALQAGLATLPITVVTFFLARRAGRMADRYGPRWFMGGGPLVAAAGLAMLQRVDAHVDYVSDILPALLLFALGLSATVAPLTATVLADADESNAGIASGVNNAIARIAGLLAVAALGAVVAGQFGTTIDERLAGEQLSPAAQRDRQRGQGPHVGTRRPPTACLPPRRAWWLRPPRTPRSRPSTAAPGSRLRSSRSRRARRRRDPQPAPRGAVRGLPGRPVRGGPARGRAPAPGAACADLTRRQCARHATPIACCAAAHGRQGR